MRGVPAWQGRQSVQHPSSVSALRADPPSPTRGEGWRHLAALAASRGWRQIHWNGCDAHSCPA
ncbi:hypothetical protein FJV76_17315 [Mesorhizobium sp. WSM4303]|nr:hypothetical protein FJV77_16600 [Mesorhizobium sp. WSM4306]TRD03042.1 hypothetical protein FJV76_17315 [Mesorhizobium sp. WSM4303]